MSINAEQQWYNQTLALAADRADETLTHLRAAQIKALQEAQRHPSSAAEWQRCSTLIGGAIAAQTEADKLRVAARCACLAAAR